MKNHIIIFTAAAYAFAILSAPLLIGSLAPAPFSPLTTIPNWASWFDIYLTFPALSILCVIPFRALQRDYTATFISLVVVIPVYLIFASYYFAYALVPFGFAIFNTPLPLLVPTIALVGLLVAPLLNSIVLSRGVSSNKPHWLNTLPKPPYFIAIAAVSLGLAIGQVYLRFSQTGGLPLTSWVSDIGIGVEAAARDLTHGVNPYVTGVPPWGGPAGLYWGPVSLVMVSPFSIFLSPGWAAHLSVLFYTALTAIGIWKCAKIFSPKLALPCALLFLALPTTSWLIEGGTTLHMIATLFIVWSLYFFLEKKHFWAGFLAGLGMMAMVIPGVLIVPYLLYTHGARSKKKVGLGFLIPIAIFFAGLFVLFPMDRIMNLLGYAAGGTFQTGYSLNLLFAPSADTWFRLIASAWLLFWFINRSFKIRGDSDLLITLAVFFLILPFAVGFYLPFFFVWGSAVALMALFARYLPRASQLDNQIPS